MRGELEKNYGAYDRETSIPAETRTEIPHDSSVGYMSTVAMFAIFMREDHRMAAVDRALTSV